MHLTNILFRSRNNFHFIKRVPGSLYRGKNRIVPPVANKDKLKMYHQMTVEEENMMYLKTPYLTEDQEHSHTKELGKRQARIDRLYKIKAAERKMPDRLAFDHLSYLKPLQSWE